MKSIRALVWAIAITSAMVVTPAVHGARANGPVSSMTKPGACSSLTYQWSGYRKAASATFRLHHNGIYQDQATVAPVGPAGSLAIPSQLAVQMLTGEHYTVLALLGDASGRAIQNSPAAWFGTC